MQTTIPIQQTAGELKPEFLPLPPPGRVCPISGLGRSYLYKLIAAGDVQSVSLRQRGKARGKRLIVADSLLGFLRSQVMQANRERVREEQDCHQGANLSQGGAV